MSGCPITVGLEAKQSCNFLTEASVGWTVVVVWVPFLVTLQRLLEDCDARQWSYELFVAQK